MIPRSPVIFLLLVLYAASAVAGITWGLPSARIDPVLFGGGPVWSGEKIAALADTSSRFSDEHGADVDVDPVVFVGDEPVELTATEADVAAIYRRYRLYTHQPDEMITMMALAGMQPGAGRLDPKLYQYGGLFVYPVGALIGLGGLTGLIEVTSDLEHYLDHPEEFGKFYLAARLYVVLWGGLGVLLVHAVASRLGGGGAGAVAGLLYVLMPVIVCMTHEAKPHLPGAVLMLAAVWWAMGYVEHGRRGEWIGMCIACGAAFGMVLSSLPIFVLIPLAEWMRKWRAGEKGAESGPGGSMTTTDPTRARPWIRLATGTCVGLAVYALTNPYVAINALVNREVLRSNLSNSTAMYEIGRVGEGLGRVLELTVEGATLPVLMLGTLALVLGIRRRRWEMLPLVVPAGLVFVQFVLLGAGKPAEYGRFGVFCNTGLAIGAGCVLAGVVRGAWSRRSRRGGHSAEASTGAKEPVQAVSGWVVGVVAVSGLVVLSTGFFGWVYLHNFLRDTGPNNTREEFATVLEACAEPDPVDGRLVVCVLADPAPYGLPPMDFQRVRLWRYPSMQAYEADPRGVLVLPADRNSADGRVAGSGQWPYSPISWANKPMVVRQPPRIDALLPRVP
ncbi:MAG: hypothetical protein GY842_00935 [bacterium]|nr:hypothetical protein [bacterium]